MGSFAEKYDEDALRAFTPEERAQLQALHQQLDDKFNELACFLAKQLGFADTDPQTREEAEQAIERWEEDAEMKRGVTPPKPTGELQRLLSEHHEIGEWIMNIRDEAFEREHRLKDTE
jgi:hypothetical protein